MRPLLPAAWLALRRGRLAVPALAAVVLVLLMLPWPDRSAVALRGVGVLLACAIATCLDEPTADLTAASPTRLRTWTAVRVAVAGSVLLPVLAGGLLVARWRFPPLPVAAHLAEAAGYLLAGVAVAAALRAWRGTALPSYPAVVGVVAVVLATWSLPRGWVMVEPQSWGPPYEAALWRWAGFMLAGVAVVLAALRDPLDR